MKYNTLVLGEATQLKAAADKSVSRQDENRPAPLNTKDPIYA